MASMDSSALQVYSNEQDTEMHDSDRISEISKGGILIDDLRHALKDHFSFTGSFAYASKLPAPNPCLNVVGAGLIGLPLNERDAGSIIECCTQTPYGHSQETLANKQVRDAWEINSQKVSFQNKAWETFVNWAIQIACHELGIQVAEVLPRCELSKLLLYEPGSRFLPHQNTQKPDGMFATMMVTLPSAYTGGQVHLSHGTQSKVFDFSEDSMTSTSVLSWYTDVVHEVKPVTSGYYLALSYNLIHVSTAVPKPMLPDLDASFHNLRKVLQKWKENVYTSVPKEYFVAYALDHEYSEDELLAGPMLLKDVDADKISILRPLAEELGFMVCLGNVTRHQSGPAKDNGYNYCRHEVTDDEDSDDESSDGLSMDEVTETETEINCLVDLKGIKLLEHELSVGDDFLIPENPFHNVKPSDKEYECCTENGAGFLDFWFARTVLVLVRNEDVLGVLCSNRRGGFKYGLRRLRESDNACPSQRDKEIAHAVIENLKSELNDARAYVPCVIASHAKLMIDYALKWNDSGMWSSIMQHTGAEILATFGVDKYFEGCEKFPFREIEKGFIGIVQKIPELKNRLDFIDAIRAYAGKAKEVIPTDWYKEQLIQALSTYGIKNESYSENVELLLRVACTWSLDVVHQSALVPWSKKAVPFDTTEFWIVLVQSLVKKKPSLCAADDEDVIQSDPNAWPKLSTKSEFDVVMKYCLKAIITQWDQIANPKEYYGYPFLRMSNKKDQTDKMTVDHIIQMLNICLSTNGCLELCGSLLDASIAVVHDPADLPLQFEKLYVPLIPKFVGLLKSHNLTITSAPFDAFSRNLIDLYLHHVLRTDKSSTKKPVIIEKIGCGCNDCHQLDTFMANPNQQEMTVWLSADARQHLQQRLFPKYSQDCTTKAARRGNPRKFQITKNEDFFQRMNWAGRKEAAFPFLGSFGNDALLQVLMGSRWNDVLVALQGTRQFKLKPVTVPSVQPAAISTQPRQGHPARARVPQQAATPSTSSTQVIDRPPRDTIANKDALGKKRKRSLEFIDPRK